MNPNGRTDLKTLLSPAVDKEINAKRLEHRAEDAVGLQAAADPTPGPMREVFGTVPDKQVGPFTFRRFVDRDFVSLGVLKHPLVQLKLENVARKAAGEIDKRFEEVVTELAPTGPDAWRLYWLLTRPAREAAAKLKEGLDVIDGEAADQFGELQLPELNELFTVAIQQFNTYWSTAIGHAPASVEGEAAKSDRNPTTSSVQPLTD